MDGWGCNSRSKCSTKATVVCKRRLCFEKRNPAKPLRRRGGAVPFLRTYDRLFHQHSAWEVGECTGPHTPRCGFFRAGGEGVSDSPCKFQPGGGNTNTSPGSWYQSAMVSIRLSRFRSCGGWAGSESHCSMEPRPAPRGDGKTVPTPPPPGEMIQTGTKPEIGGGSGDAVPLIRLGIAGVLSSWSSVRGPWHKKNSKSLAAQNLLRPKH